jgi:uncharacterized protein
MSGESDGQLVERQSVPGIAPVPGLPELVHELYEDPRLNPPPDSTLFVQEAQPAPPPMRFPNFADLGMAVVLLVFGGIAAAALTALALHFHFFGVATAKQAGADVRYALGIQLVWYLLSFAGCLLVFPAVWRTGFFAGVEWRIFTALRARWRLVSATLFCFALAILDMLLLPGPEGAPIDEVFRRPGAAWFMFVFGITLAPFFEEMFFRGFLLPALCTAWDWASERIQHQPAPYPDAEGRTIWSVPAMTTGSILASIPFALMHGTQTGHSFGPFLLLFCVSLVLCAVRLGVRSLAASTFVHASYNFILFSFMIAQTGGFQHLDKL